VTTTTTTRLYGPATARSWNRLHPRLTHRSAWAGEIWPLPVIEGTVIRLEVARLPSGAIPRPVWLWYSGVDLPAADADRLWHAFLRRFDIEHTFRMLKQTLGWTCPKIRDPGAADTWTWLILAAYAQLRLARPLAAGLRRPWEKPPAPGRLTPARVRRGFRNLRAKAAQPAGAQNPPSPARAGHQDHLTAGPPPATTSTSSPPARPRQPEPASPGHAAQVKNQVRGCPDFAAGQCGQRLQRRPARFRVHPG